MSILVVLAIEGRPPIVETVGLTIVLEVAAVVGGVGAGALMAEGVAFDVVKAAAVVAAAIGPPGGPAVVPGGPTGPARPGPPCCGGTTGPCGLFGGICVWAPNSTHSTKCDGKSRKCGIQLTC